MQGVQALGNSMPQQPHPRPYQPWHNPAADNETRGRVMEQILQIFRRRQMRQSGNQNLEGKMPDFTRRLEDALYKSAPTKEDYVNPATLEHRLQDVAQRMVGSSRLQKKQENGVAGGPQDSTATSVTSANGFGGTANSAASVPAMQSAGNGQPGYPQMASEHVNRAQPGGAPAAGPSGQIPTSAGAQGPNQAPRPFQAGPVPNGFPPGAPGLAMGGNALANGPVKLEGPAAGMGQLGGEGVQRQPGIRMAQPQAPGGSLMSNGLPVLRQHTNRDAYAQPLMNGMMQQQQPKVGMNGMGRSEAMVGGAGMMPGIPSPSASGMQHIPRSPLLSRAGNGSAVGLNGMIPTSAVSGQPQGLLGAGQHGMSGQHAMPMASSPLVSMSMIPTGQPGDGRRPGSAGGMMVPMNSMPMNSMPMNSMPMMGQPAGDQGPMMGNGPLPGHPGMGNGLMNGHLGHGGPMGNGNLMGSMAMGMPGGGGMPMGSAPMMSNGSMGNSYMGNGGSMGGLPSMMVGMEGGGGSGDGMPAMGGMPPGQLPQVPLPMANGGGEHSNEMEFQMKLSSNMPGSREYIAKQQRWLLFLRHCAKCNAQQGECQYGQSCTVAKALWRHILECANPQCQYPRCLTSRDLLKHHQKCQSNNCPICTPVKQYVQKQRREMQTHQQVQDQQAQSRFNAQLTPQQQQHYRQQQQQQLYQQQQQQMQMMNAGRHQGMMNGGMHPHLRNQGMHTRQQQYPDMGHGHPGMMMGAQGGQGQAGMLGVRRPASHMNGGAGMHPEEPPSKRYRKVITSENTGTSLLEAFTVEEVQTHLNRLQKAAPSSTREPSVPCNPANPEACSACGVVKLAFEPAAVFCTSCNQRIKKNQVYHSFISKEVKGNWCHNCFSEEKRDTLECDGHRVRKVDAVKQKNDFEQEEGWVECDHCGRWVHQICGLFNKGSNNAHVTYMCPDCLIHGIVTNKRKPIEERPQAMLEARELPRCSLSDFLETQLKACITEDTRLRALKLGRPESEVPQASPSGLTVRVINNITKKLDVKQRFLETFKNEGYPAQFQYKQKVIILFQRINGVDVVLYTLYMQEYGHDCPAPNSRWVYLSYLDSVKYFEPEINSEIRPGVALRTVVYHNVLQSYLEYVKQRGYCAMFIWACPPFAGDDYILHCHPSRQKMPRSDRLREWYLSMLRASKEKGVVTHLSNLYDTFFEGGRDHREKATSAAMPYLDGDYWPGEAENLLSSISEETRQAGKKGKKAGAAGKGGAARPGKKGKRYGATGTTDEQLMAKLGETVQGMKEDFIVVHLQEPCSFCRCYISDQDRWYHPAPPQKVVVKHERSFEGINLETPGATTKQTASLTRFQLCTKCYENEKSEDPSRMRGLPANIPLGELQKQRMEAIGPTHDTGNPTTASEFFDTRQQFLSLCQGNHYQFDTLRRAKHSSMMVLYHLHNPDAPAFASNCNNCQLEIEPGHGYRCTVCQDYDLCRACKENPNVVHPHPMRANLSAVNDTQVRLTHEQQADRAAQLQRTMELLVHASGCNNAQCNSANCQKVKKLFEHAVGCQLRLTGGCALCRRMWALLQLHAKQCQESACPVPRCRELRDARLRQAARQEASRRSGYQNMLRKQQHELQAR